MKNGNKKLMFAAMIMAAIAPVFWSTHRAGATILNPEVDTFSTSGNWNSLGSHPFTQQVDAENLQVGFKGWTLEEDPHAYIRFNLDDVDNWDTGDPERLATLRLYVTEVSGADGSLRVSRIDPANTNTDVAHMDFLYNYVNYDGAGDPITDGSERRWVEPDYGVNVFREGTGVGDAFNGPKVIKDVESGFSGWVEFDVTQMVDAWLGDGDLNNGFIISPRDLYSGNPGGSDIGPVYLASNEYPDESLRPAMELIPEPSTLVLFGVAGLLLMKRRRL